jgi:hypothetical protein
MGREFQFADFETSRWAAIVEGTWLSSSQQRVKDWS